MGAKETPQAKGAQGNQKYPGSKFGSNLQPTTFLDSIEPTTEYGQGGGEANQRALLADWPR